MNLTLYWTRIVGALLTAFVSFQLVNSSQFAYGQAENKKKARPFPLLGSEHGTKKGGIVYSSGQNKKGEKYELKLDVYMPNGKGPHPTVLAVHGGAWRSGAKWHMIRHAWRFVEKGYCVVAINYRHAPNYKFPAQIHDVKSAVRWMRVNHKDYKIDPDQIVAFGYSAGGHLVSLLGTTDSDDGLEGFVDEDEKKISTRVRAVAAGGAPCEFTWIAPNARTLHYWMGKTRKQDPELWKRASPISFATKDDPPFLFLHGELDTVVPGSTSKKMHEALEEVKVSSTRKVYKGHAHISLFSNLEIVDDMTEFFDKVLKEKDKPKTAPKSDKQ